MTTPIAIATVTASAAPFHAPRLNVDTMQELAALIDGAPRQSLLMTDVPDDIRQDNGVRAGWAARALVAYAQHLSDGRTDDELEVVLADLLADLHHLADALGVDWAAADETACRNHAAELAGEP